ncbi:MAG: hypothetical protein HZT40_22110 [Candidatus Thiothrix singaporensis]|uniref:Uncharacterized protein n=1 Tax=Candidatus Thiothrix singaporensis TaxID=2799669 RepID=A0A7L6AXJ1_9GAMM|nr:MAG: hypothetical protein HZT40_22110 [Candidatus Thiothrix singaporensis]
MSDKPKYNDLKKRIEEHLAWCPDSNTLEDVTIAWDGYIAALLEWSLISIDEHDALQALFPKLSRNNPVIQIFLGVDEDK